MGHSPWGCKELDMTDVTEHEIIRLEISWRTGAKLGSYSSMTYAKPQKEKGLEK